MKERVRGLREGNEENEEKPGERRERLRERCMITTEAEKEAITSANAHDTLGKLFCCINFSTKIFLKQTFPVTTK